MPDEVKLSRIAPVFAELDYPISRDALVAEMGEMTVLLADGEANFGELIGEANQEIFDSEDDLLLEVMNLLPRRAVGEPYQSEGEG